METVFGYQNGGVSNTRLDNLENSTLKVAYYAEITSTSGQISIPSGFEILLNQWANEVDAILSAIPGGTGTHPDFQDTGEDVTSFDTSGNFIVTALSGSPSALIYVGNIKLKDLGNLDVNRIIGEPQINLNIVSSEYIVYVAENGSDVSGDGNVGSPFATIQTALNSIGDAANTTEYEDENINRRVVKIGPGKYVENLTIPQRNIIVLDLEAAVIEGNITYNVNSSLGGSSHPATLILQGDTLRGAHTSTSVPIVGVDGNVIITSTGTSIVQIMTFMIGIKGEVQIGGTGGSKQLYTNNTNIIGGIVATGTCRIDLYSEKSDTSSSSSIGGVEQSGGTQADVRFKIIKNIRFTGAVKITGSGSNFLCRDTEFVSGHAHDLTGNTFEMNMDANSYRSYFDNVPSKGSETYIFADAAIGIHVDTANFISPMSSADDTTQKALETISPALPEPGTTDGQMAFWDNTAGRWVYTEISELFWDDVNKRLGVNTNSPAEELHVEGNIKGGNVGFLILGAGSYNRLGFTTSHTSGAHITTTNAAATIKLRPQGIDKVIVDANGNVLLVESLTVGGGNIRSISTKTADYTLLGNDYIILADATSNTVTITLPAAPVNGQIFNIKCINAIFTCTISRNGNNIDGVASDLVLVLNENKTLQYDTTYGWAIL